MNFRKNSQKSAANNLPISREHALNCIPVKNPEIAERKDKSGELCLTYQVRVRPWFQNIVQKFTGRGDDLIERKLQLDYLGATVWEMIDGRCRTKQIIKNFQTAHQLNSREAEISVTTFLKELGKRGLIAMREGE